MKVNIQTQPPFIKDGSKGIRFETQKQKVFRAFCKEPSTMLMISVNTGVLRANICRYVAEWRKDDRIIFIEQKTCPISKYKAGFYRGKVL